VCVCVYVFRSWNGLLREKKRMIPILGLGLMGVVALLRLRPDRLLGLGVGVFYGLTVSIATVLRVLPKKKQKKPMMVSDYISMKKVAR